MRKAVLLAAVLAMVAGPAWSRQWFQSGSSTGVPAGDKGDITTNGTWDVDPGAVCFDELCAGELDLDIKLGDGAVVDGTDGSIVFEDQSVLSGTGSDVSMTWQGTVDFSAVAGATAHTQLFENVTSVELTTPKDCVAAGDTVYVVDAPAGPGVFLCTDAAANLWVEIGTADLTADPTVVGDGSDATHTITFSLTADNPSIQGQTGDIIALQAATAAIGDNTLATETLHFDLSADDVSLQATAASLKFVTPTTGGLSITHDGTLADTTFQMLNNTILFNSPVTAYAGATIGNGAAADETLVFDVTTGTNPTITPSDNTLQMGDGVDGTFVLDFNVTGTDPTLSITDNNIVSDVPLSAPSFVVSPDPGDNARAITLSDNTASCPAPADGVNICSVNDVLSSRVNGGVTVRHLRNPGSFIWFEDFTSWYAVDDSSANDSIIMADNPWRRIQDGTLGSVALEAPTSNSRYGTIKLATGVGENGWAAIMHFGHEGSSAGHLINSPGLSARFRVQRITSCTAVNPCHIDWGFGTRPSDGTTEPSNGAFWRVTYPTDTTIWTVTRDGGVEEEQDTGVSFDSAAHTFEVRFNAADSVSFLRDDVEENTHTVAANIPDGTDSMMVYMRIYKASTGSADATDEVRLDWVEVSDGVRD